jgi:hypothetical protein
MTTKAETFCCFAASRLHWRRYSRNSASTAVANDGEGDENEGEALKEALDFDTFRFEVSTGASHQGKAPHMSHDPQVSHFVRSPKCEQI